MQRAVVVTGVSSGIGYVTAKYLIQKGFHVFGSVRKQEDANCLEKEFGGAFTPLIFDITDEKAVRDGAEKVRSRLKCETLAGLVNNAGIAVPGPLLLVRPEDFRHQLEVNLTGQLVVIQSFASLLGTDPTVKGPPGRIVNIGSISGMLPIPFVGAYSTSKFGFRGFTEELRLEMKLYGIDVSLVCPGAYDTSIWRKNNRDEEIWAKSDYASALTKFRNMLKQRMAEMPTPEPIAEIVFHALTSTHPKALYISVPNYFRDWLLPRYMPRGIKEKVIAKFLGLGTKRDG